MCCLFGMIDSRGRFTSAEKSRVLSVLAAECEERGTDATGIAYCTHNRLSIYKRPMEAHRLRFRIPEDTRTVMGHTRMTTQGMAIKNRNNHPFPGNAGGQAFALAHNGVLYNDRSLRRAKHLPKTKIETDSYIAVQLIEQQKTLDFSSLRYMAEQVEGSFVFTVLDRQENLYLVKGNNPLCIYHYPDSGVYLYASTEKILTRALGRLGLPLEDPEYIVLECGDIMKITASGERDMASFDTYNMMPRWNEWPEHRAWKAPVWKGRAAESEYLDELKSMAGLFGFSPEFIDRLLDAGFTADEIEEYLYEGGMY